MGLWNQLTPLYPQFHEDNKTISLLWTEYHDSFPAFYENYVNDINEHGESHEILSSKGMPLPNGYVVSCIPWFTFQGFSLHNHGIKTIIFPVLNQESFLKQRERLLCHYR